MAHSRDVEEREEAVKLIDLYFEDLHYKEKAWKDILLLINDEGGEVGEYAYLALCSIFPYLENKKQAWNDILLLTNDKNSLAYYNIAISLQYIIPHVQDKKQVWNTIVSFIENGDGGVKFQTTYTIGLVFKHLPNKKKATNYLLSLAKGDNFDILVGVACALGPAYIHITDKENAWQTLITLAKSYPGDIADSAFESIGEAFPYTLNKKQANEDLLSLMEDESEMIIRNIVNVFKLAFQYFIDKEHATQYLLSHTHHKDEYIRIGVASALGSSFPFLTDKVNALEKLLSLSRDKSKYVKRNVARSLGSVFPHITDKDTLLSTLTELSEDDDGDVRASAHHSIGRAFIFRATKTESNNGFREELKKAIQFFEKSFIEGGIFSPANFCLPFYLSFYVITSGKKDVEGLIEYYLEKASIAVEDSENREKLLEAVDNLSEALKKAHETDKMDFDTIKSNLNAYRRYCDRACELLDSTEKTTSGAVNLMRRGLPIIDENIKKILVNIEEKSKEFCNDSKRTAFKNISRKTYENVKGLGEVNSTVEAEIMLNKSIPLYRSTSTILPNESGVFINELLDEMEIVELDEKVKINFTIVNTIVLQIHNLQEKLNEKDKLIEYFKNILVNQLDNINYGVFKIKHRSAEMSLALNQVQNELKKINKIKNDLDNIGINLEEFGELQNQNFQELNNGMNNICNIIESEIIPKLPENEDKQTIIDKIDELKQSDAETLFNRAAGFSSIIGLILPLLL